MQLAPALADQTEHQRVGVAVLRQHRKQRGLADAGAGEDAKPLTPAAGREKIERADPEIEPLAQAAPEMGGNGARLQRIVGSTLFERRSLVQRAAERIDHASEPAGTGTNHLAFRRQFDRSAQTDAVEFFERKEDGTSLGKRHDLREKMIVGRSRASFGAPAFARAFDRADVADAQDVMQAMAEQACALASADFAPKLERRDSPKPCGQAIEPFVMGISIAGPCRSFVHERLFHHRSSTGPARHFRRLSRPLSSLRLIISKKNTTELRLS